MVIAGAFAQVDYLSRQFVAAKFQANQTLTQARVIRVHQTFFHESEQTGNRGFRFLVRQTQPRQSIFGLVGTLGS
ncbi:hypothetical protein BFN67_15230 [Pseudaminobacter manganicus]|uniref:Uncharacterized protein n=1 Tax=Manganibacter manganicus TaxID=1873176 RepID=A0A1V8RSW1_9HYPH|nr:hypothetical protein BFN67_15230 [Pseudaminobacter manganicus]